MDKCWIVAYIDYEDFHIVGVFLDKDEAERVAANQYAVEVARRKQFWPESHAPANLYHVTEFTFNDIHPYE